MPKEMVSIPEGNLLSVAKSKGITTLSALKEKTGVDRKTLRAINAGRPVKQTKLQSIADKLRIPISHLLNANKSEVAGSKINEIQYREVKLQQLDAAALRKIASEYYITWFLNIDQISDEIEGALLELRASLNRWFEHINMEWDWDPGEEDNLIDQILHIKASAGIDKSVEALARHKLKIYGGTYLAWDMRYPIHEGRRLPILEYYSGLRAALSIAPENRVTSTARVGIGWVPPQKFVESELVGIERVEVDGTQVWSSGTVSDEVAKFDEARRPFLLAVEINERRMRGESDAQ
jgi:transcriptional regulator with XRE-family HTH domain